MSPFAPLQTEVKVDDKVLSVAHRGTPCDTGVIAQTFTHRQYVPNADRDRALHAEYERILEAGAIPLVIDAGANIGTSTLWFGTTFPKAHIVSVEPDPENQAFLTLNAREVWADIRRGAVASERGLGSLLDPGRGPLGYMTGAFGGGKAILRFAIEDLIAEKTALGMVPFILKCDIEGGEEDLFSSGDRWVNAFYLVVVEPHDWLFPGRATFRTALRSFAAHARDFIFYGENVFSYRNDAPG